MNLLTKDDLHNIFDNKRVVLFGSAPSCLHNKGPKIDQFDVIVRISNYKIKGIEDKVGTRTDVFYSFFGSSIRKTKEELIGDGVKYMMCKCPDAECHESADKERNLGGDFRYIYKNRKDWWFTPVHIPTKEHYMQQFNLLGRHVPTTGFSAILTLSNLHPSELYITGFDFFSSKLHNINEAWRLKNPDDPVGHRPKKEYRKLLELVANKKFMRIDNTLKRLHFD